MTGLVFREQEKHVVWIGASVLLSRTFTNTGFSHWNRYDAGNMMKSDLIVYLPHLLGLINALITDESSWHVLAELHG